jgi:hypothetical protein
VRRYSFVWADRNGEKEMIEEKVARKEKCLLGSALYRNDWFTSVKGTCINSR